MTIRSMTGFGSAEASSQGWVMRIESRSVNHRGLDVRVWAPRDWAWIEPFVLDCARKQFHRGRVEVRVDIEPAPSAETRRIDPVRFAEVAAELRSAAESAGLGGDVRVVDVLSFDEVRATTSSSDLPDDVGEFEGAIEHALGALGEARTEEGRRLHATMETLTEAVAAAIAAIEELAPTVAEQYRARLEERVLEALEKFGVDELDERSVMHEVALYAERSDISEELQRAGSHIVKLRELLAEVSDGPIGKQLDFYLQELFREANTTGSKSGSVEITDHVIVMKSAIEKMREQAANIE